MSHAHVRTIVVVLSAMLVAAATAQASAPLAKTTAPGWYRMMLGDFEVTAINDGTTALPVDQILKGTTPEKVDAVLAANHLKSPLETSVNGYVINTGSKLILIDTGAGTLFGPTLNKFLTNFKASGYSPEQVDEIYITHMHADHVGGLSADGKPVFPNAVVRAGKADADFWLSKENMEKAPEQMKRFFQGAQVSLNPYVQAGKFKAIEADGELVPGIKSIATPGHTPGHTIYSVESGGQKLVVIGDLMHVAAVQFPDPSVTIQFDTDQKSAAAQRKKLYADAAAKGYALAIAHVAFPGIGYIKTDAKGYRWLPVNYVANIGTAAK